MLNTKEKAAANLDLLAAAARGNPDKLMAVARLAVASGRRDVAHDTAREAQSLAPDRPDILVETRHIIAEGVPRWHFHIVRDERRNALYDAAIRRAVKPGDRVLDIGSGTGLLAMMAARAGAAHVYSCEMNPAVAEAAGDIVALNGLGDTVTVIARNSQRLDPDELGGPVDVLVSEIISNNLIGQHALPVMADAVRRLLKPGGVMIPASGQVVVALAELKASGPPDLDQVAGFDVSPFNRLARTPYPISIASPDVVLRSAAGTLFDFDFITGGPWPSPRASLNLVATGGRADGILQWIRLQLDDLDEYESAPGSAPPPAAWAMLFHPFDEPRDLAPDAIVRVHGRYDHDRVHVWAENR